MVPRQGFIGNVCVHGNQRNDLVLVVPEQWHFDPFSFDGAEHVHGQQAVRILGLLQCMWCCNWLVQRLHVLLPERFENDVLG